MLRKYLAIALAGAFAPGLTGCQSAPADDGALANPATGMLIARDSCSRCHQTGRGGEGSGARRPTLAGGDPPIPDAPLFSDGESPNPRAPSFVDIANRPGMTVEGIAAWLRDGHNYPVEMGFHLEPHQVDALAAYLIRLRGGDAEDRP